MGGRQKEVHNPDSVNNPSPLAMWTAAEYMGWEKANAIKQEEEFERLMKERGPAKPRWTERRQNNQVQYP